MVKTRETRRQTLAEDGKTEKAKADPNGRDRKSTKRREVAAAFATKGRETLMNGLVKLTADHTTREAAEAKGTAHNKRDGSCGKGRENLDERIG